MAVFNEVAASVYIYIMMLLTDFWGENHFRNKIGWTLLFFLSFVVGINFLKVLYAFIKWVPLKFMQLTKRFRKSNPTVPIKPTIHSRFESQISMIT